MDAIDLNLQAYDRDAEALCAECAGKWVVYVDRQRVGTFGDFNAAAEWAVPRYGRGPYLIHQVVPTKCELFGPQLK